MEFKAKVTYTKKIDQLSKEKDLWTKGIPDLGFAIRGIVKVGLTVAYQVSVSTKLAASAEFTMGATAELPNDKGLVIDLLEPDRSGYDDSGQPLIFPIFTIDSLTGSAKFAVASQANLAFGLEISEVEKIDIEFNLKIPQLSIALNAGYGRLRPGHWVHRPLFVSFNDGICTDRFASCRRGRFLQQRRQCFQVRRQSLGSSID